MDRDALALEELRLLQSVIARQDDIRFKIKTWATTIFGVLAAGLFTEKVQLSPAGFLVASFLVAILFWALDAVYRTSEERAIIRSRAVEECLRKGHPYDGPLVADSLSRRAYSDEYLQSLRRGRVYALYLILIVLALALALLRIFHRP